MQKNHGRVVRIGQVWRSNDPRRFKAIRILDIDRIQQVVYAENILTGNCSQLALRAFTIGSRGWSLDHQPPPPPPPHP